MNKFLTRFFAFTILAFFVCGCHVDNSSLAGKVYQGENDIDKKVEEILAKMDLKDKCGEMTQLSIDMLSEGSPYNLKKPNTFDPKKLQEVLVDLRVGSILNCGGHEYTVDKWREIITTIQDYAVNKKASGIPVLYGIDAVHGANYSAGSTLFPQQIGIAATWDPTFAYDAAEICAYETKACFIPWNFSPILDVGRDRRWSRLWETYGEDVHLVSKMGEATVKGYSDDDITKKNKVASCMKHFLGYSLPFSGKDRSPVYIHERQMREYFLPSFQAAIDAGANTIMINSGELNGIPVHANPKILIDLLRNELGFEGLAVSDWEDIIFLYSRHRVAKDYKEAIAIAINAGIDMSMVPVDLKFPVLLRELVEEGKIPMSRIDEAVTRILKLKIKLGLFEEAIPKDKNFPDYGGEKFEQVAFNAAKASMTLLKNDKNILPISKDKKILITGPTANSIQALNGGWSHTWLNRDKNYYTKGKPNIVEALKTKFGASQITFVPGTSIEVEKGFMVDKEIDIAAAAEAAKSADVAIVCLGEMPYTEITGNIDNLEMPLAQQKLVEAIAATGTPIVLVLVEGRPRTISKFEDKAQGILMAYLPSNEGGRAIAEVLSGDHNPSGKLPYTYPKHPNTLYTYDHKGTELVAADFSSNAFQPQFEFGFGLSYTTFKYSNLKVSSEKIGMDATLSISVDVSNTGKRTGKEVVQLFIHDKVASITPPMKRLRGFDKISLDVGESKTVQFEIKSADLAFVGVDNKWITEAGEFEIQIADLKKTFEIVD